jgi:hypothetical protein
MDWRIALKKIRLEQGVLRGFVEAPMTITAAANTTEYVVCSSNPGSAPEGAPAQAAAVEIRAVWRKRRWRQRSVKYVVSGFAWFATTEAALARTRGSHDSPNGSGGAPSVEHSGRVRRCRAVLADKLRAVADRIAPAETTE